MRATTRTPSTLASALMISSVTPSEKYSFSCPPLRFAKGSTAMEAARASSALLTLSPRKKKYQTMPGAAASTPMAVSTSAMCVPLNSRPEAGVRSRRPAFTSKIQARLTTMGKPIASATTT